MAEKKKMRMAYMGIGALIVILISYGVYDYSNSKPDETTEFATPETDSDKYNSKLEALESKQESARSSNLLDVFTNDAKDSITEDTISEEELKLKAQIETLNKTSNTTKTKPKPKKDVYGDYSMWEDSNKETKTTKTSRNSNNGLSYEEQLELAKQRRISNNTSSNTKSDNKTIQTRIAVFRDQFLLPSELAEFVLTEDFSYKGKLFKKGTPVYGYINIRKSRVLFDIKNIAHVPLKIEVRDIRDGLVGMYSSNAGHLWKEYQAKGMNKNTQDVSNEVTNNRILSNSIDAISKFFQKSRIKKNEKIMLLNDQQLIVHILNE